MSSRTVTLAAAPGQEMHPAGHPAAGPPGVMHFSQPLVPVAPPGVAAQTQEAQSASEFTHLCTTFGDCIEALPPTLTRSISDLRELDAVLSGSISTITDQLNELLAALQDPSITAQHRFHLLRRIADEAKDFRLGGEDKIRVATGTCETLIHHTNQLDVLAGLLSTLLPTSMAGTIPPPSWPHGYPILFPTQASASGSAYRKPDFLPSSQAYGRHPAMLHNPSAMGYTHANGYYTTRQQELYSHAADSVRNYVKEGAALPDEHRIKHHVKKQRQDTSLHAGGKSRNNTSHMPTSEHKHRGGKPAPNPTLAASSSQFSNLHSVPTGINHLGQLGGMSATMAATSSAQSQIPASPLLVHPGGGHPRLSFDKDGNPLPPMLVDPNDPSELSYGREMNGSAQVVPSASAAMPAAKKRRTSNKDKQFSQSDYGENAGGEGQDDYVPPASVSRDRQNSSRGAMQGQSAQGTAAAGSKRSRNNSKKGGLDSPDPGSPFAASASGRSAAGVQAPKRKSSQLLEQHDVDTLARPASRNAGNNVGPASVHEGSRLAAATVADAADLEADLDMVGDDADDGEGNDGGDDTRTYCYCDRVSFGNMIGCDGEDCAREWFHLACVGMDTPPKGEWYCDDCEEKRKRELHLGKPKKR